MPKLLVTYGMRMNRQSCKLLWYGVDQGVSMGQKSTYSQGQYNCMCHHRRFSFVGKITSLGKKNLGPTLEIEPFMALVEG